jgi:hypothetical protein
LEFYTLKNNKLDYGDAKNTFYSYKRWYLAWFNELGLSNEDFNLSKVATQFAKIELQLYFDWFQTNWRDLRYIPHWQQQLWRYELSKKSKKKITLPGTINPDKEKYNMAKFELSGVALEERIVEMEIETSEVENIQDAARYAEQLATKEFLQQHPECISIEWVKINGNSQ